MSKKMVSQYLAFQHFPIKIMVVVNLITILQCICISIVPRDGNQPAVGEAHTVPAPDPHQDPPPRRAHRLV